MANNKANKFNFRAFLGVYMAISGIVMTISGIILYISPQGRIAHWSYWAIAGLTKTEWQNIHTIFTFIFVIAGGLHIYYNWKPLMNYLRRKSKETPQIRKEMIFAVIFSAIIFSGTYGNVFPFSSVIDFGEEITDSWSNENNEPPIPHAEELSIAEFARIQKISVEKYQQLLKQSGYSVSDTSMTIQQVADQYNVTPSAIGRIIPNSGTIGSTNTSIYKAGSGYGRKLLSEIIKENNLSWKESIAKLNSKGIVVENDDKLKNIANDNSVLPIDIIKILEL